MRHVQITLSRGNKNNIFLPQYYLEIIGNIWKYSYNLCNNTQTQYCARMMGFEVIIPQERDSLPCRQRYSIQYDGFIKGKKYKM